MLPKLILCLAAAANVGDWIAQEGGSITRDASGQVVAIDLTGSWITDADLRRLESFNRLRSLNLTRTKITDVGMEHLAKLTSVTDLNLYFAEYITEDGIAHLKGWTSLERLNLHGTKVTSKVFPILARLTALKSLDLGSTQIDDEGFEELAGLPRLEELAIGANRLTGSCLPLLKPLAQLRRLDVGGIQRVDSGLWGVALTDYNLARLAALTQLESLTLSGANLSDRGVDRPGQAEAIRGELRDLSPLAGLVNLRMLDLSNTPVTASALTVLASMPRLHELRLGLTPHITDASVEKLLAMKQVKVLYVGSSGISADGLARLRAEGRYDKLDAGDAQ